jgi:peroxiredoxin
MQGGYRHTELMDQYLTALPAGTPAPLFTLPRTRNESFSVVDARGRFLVLLFYPGDWEPASMSQLTVCQRFLEVFKQLGALLVGISVDSVWSHLAFARAQGLRFPLLADHQPTGDVARAYGVHLETEGTSGRALFVIDGEGIIRWSRVYPLSLDPGVDGVLTALEDLQQKRLSAAG